MEYVWNLSFTANKELNIEITNSDTIKTVDATMSVSTSDLKVKKVRGLIKKRTRIISGEITRVITFGNGDVYTIVGTYYDCESDSNVDEIKYTREFFKGDSDEPFRVVTVYCKQRD